MEFVTNTRIKPNSHTDIPLPDMTKRYMVPREITIHQLEGPKDAKTEAPARDIQVRVSAATELLNLSETYWQTNDTIDLSPVWGMVEPYGRVKLQICNKSRDHREYSIVTTYTESTGGVIYQERTDVFDKIITNILNAGQCSKIVFSFNKRITNLSFLTTSTCTKGDWISSFEAEIADDADENTQYTFDFTDPGLGEYAEELENLNIEINSGSDSPPLMAYVTAYGFRKK